MNNTKKLYIFIFILYVAIAIVYVNTEKLDFILKEKYSPSVIFDYHYIIATIYLLIGLAYLFLHLNHE